MRQLMKVLTLFAALLLGNGAAAQDQAWVQIEAQPTLAQAESRARAYGQVFPAIAGFQMNSGWYAIVLGPFTPDAALNELARLRSENLIPTDSFIAGGAAFRRPFWPVGQNPAEAPLTGALPAVAPEFGATVPSVTATALPETPGPEATLPETPAPQAAPEATPAPAPVIAALVPALPDESPAEARRSEATLTGDERQGLQSALKWFGFYDGAIDGAIGPGTRASMAAWQGANGHEATGVMTTAQRAQMLGDMARIQAELGLQTITENEAGIEISLPMALVAFDQYEPPFVHYTSKDNSGIRAILISLPGDQSALFGLYDSLQTLRDVPPTGERNRGERSFTISAVNGSVASHSYAELSQGLIKGYMLIWNPSDAAGAAKAGRALAAMKATFKPLGRRALDPGLVALSDGTRRSLLAGMEVRRPALSRSGFYVSDAGVVLTTTEALDGCTRLTLDRDTDADVSFRDDALGLALLTPRKPLAPRHVAAFSTLAPRIGAEVAVAGYSYEDALPSPTLTFGALEDAKGLNGETALHRLSLAALPGDAGGPVIDGTGAVLGMLMPRRDADGRVLPPDVSFLTTGGALMSALSVGGVQAQTASRAGALAPEDLTDLATSMTVLVSCWK